MCAVSVQAPRLASKVASVFVVGDVAEVEAEVEPGTDFNAAAAKPFVAEPGFDPGTFGLWAQHASHCTTPLHLPANSKSLDS